MRHRGFLLAIGLAAWMAVGAAAARAEALQADEASADKTLSQAQADAAAGAMEDRMSLGAPASETLPANAEVSPEQAQASDWLWGEVISVDAAANALSVKHLDYETADWVAKTVNVDDKTVFQGVSALADIKAGANVTVEYTQKDGRSVADVIEVSPKEAESPSSAPQEEGSVVLKQDLGLNESTETAGLQEQSSGLNESTETAGFQGQSLDLNESAESAGDSSVQTGVSL